MTRRAAYILCCAAVLLVCALSTRGTVFWMLFWVLLMLFFASMVSALWTRATLSVSCGLDDAQVERGDEVVLSIRIRHSCPLPVAAIGLSLFSMNGKTTYPLLAPVQPFIMNVMHYAIACPHVGAYASGVSAVYIRDVFGLFRLTYKMKNSQTELLVLPTVRLMSPLLFSPGDSDNESMMARAFEDATMPTDLRAFQQGDELKKVHWKLSMRRKELLVRVYEQPQKQDALLLVDCSPPDTSMGTLEDVRDAICDTAASVAQVALQNGAPIRMPLLSDTPVDISCSKPEEIAMVRDALARCTFDGAEAFERVLMMETRRMRKTGSTAIVTSRLNPALADMALRMRRMGPKVRVIAVADESDETIAMLRTRLMRNDVEVEVARCALR